MRHRIIIAILILGACWTGADLLAEVRAVTDHNGQFTETRFLFQETQTFGSIGPNVWTPVGRRGTRGATLNPNGDAVGDLWPAVVDTGLGPHYAWAVWSRLVNLDYELVWSRWTAGGWRMTSPVYPTDAYPGADLDADVTIDITGRPYLTWWRDENGQGRVYLSLFLVTQWMEAYPISELGVDARFPVIEINAEGDILVTYETAEGTIEQTILFDEPVTITDDIDPLDYISDGGKRYVGEADP